MLAHALKQAKPQFELVAYSLSAPVDGTKSQAAPSSTGSSSASGNTASSAGVQGTAIQLRGGEFFFRLSTKSTARPGKVTFVFKNVGHVLHDFTIDAEISTGSGMLGVSPDDLRTQTLLTPPR